MHYEEEKTWVYQPEGPQDPSQAPTVRQGPGAGPPPGAGPQQPPIAPTIRQGAPGAPPYQAPGPAYPAAPGVQKTVVMGEEEGAPLLAWLVITKGARRGKLFALSEQDTTIGRDYHCDIVLEDETISRQHAKIKLQKEGDDLSFYLYDLASTAGTTVNDEEIMKHCLEDGDRIVLGHTHLVFKQV